VPATAKGYSPFTIYDTCGLGPLRETIVGLWLKAGPVINLDLREHSGRLRSGSAVQNHARALAATEAGDRQEAARAIAADIQDAAEFIIASGGLSEHHRRP
jgi:DNA-binding GntR family transcriptional regulator